MKIKSKLLLIAGSSLAVISCIGIALYISVVNFDKAIEKNKIVNKIAVDAFNRRLILDDYILYGSQRTKDQLKLSTQSLTDYVNQQSIKFSQDKEKDFINSLITDVNDSGQLFISLSSLYESTTTNKLDLQQKNDNETRLASQLLVKAQDAISNINQLSLISISDLMSIRTTTIFLLIGFVFSFVVVAVTVVFLLWRSVVNPLTRLQNGLEAITKGDIKHELDKNIIESKDEIGDVARAFQRTMVSLNILMRENNLEKKQEIIENRPKEIKVFR